MTAEMEGILLCAVVRLPGARGMDGGMKKTRTWGTPGDERDERDEPSRTVPPLCTSAKWGKVHHFQVRLNIIA
jgi:hypothetical protein